MKARLLGVMRIVGIITIAWITCVAQLAYARDSFPERPIRIVIGFSPGGFSDITVRIVAAKLGELLGQPVLVENRPGASGTIALAAVAKSEPDGYTLGQGANSTLFFTPHVYPDLSYNFKSFQPISRFVKVPTVLVVNRSLPVNNVKELIALAKSRPGMLTYGSAGAGTTQQLSAELFKFMTGTKILEVPYKGGAPIMIDLTAGRIDMDFELLSVALPYLRSGTVKALAVSSAKRSALLPDLPAMAETLPGYDLSVWGGFLGPAGMPKNVVEKLHMAISQALSSPDVRNRLLQQGGEPIEEDSPAEFAEALRRESIQWADFFKKTGLKLRHN